jgi:hypothetical protein
MIAGPGAAIDERGVLNQEAEGAASQEK